MKTNTREYVVHIHVDFSEYEVRTCIFVWKSTSYVEIGTLSLHRAGDNLRPYYNSWNNSLSKSLCRFYPQSYFVQGLFTYHGESILWAVIWKTNNARQLHRRRHNRVRSNYNSWTCFYIPTSLRVRRRRSCYRHQPKKAKASFKSSHESGEDIPLWRTVDDDVILCGKRSLNCKNVGNNLFRDYVAAAVLLDLKFHANKSYNKEFSLLEIYDNLKTFQWRRMEGRGGSLPENERKTKIRKAFNDRRHKLK